MRSELKKAPPRVYELLENYDDDCFETVFQTKEIEEVYHHRLQASKEEIYEACNGLVSEHHVFMLQTIKRDIASVLLFYKYLICSFTQYYKLILFSYEKVFTIIVSYCYYKCL